MKSECAQVPEARAVLPANLRRLHRGPDPVFRAAWVGEKRGGGLGGWTEEATSCGAQQHHLRLQITHRTHASAGNVRLSASLTDPGGGGGGAL